MTRVAVIGGGANCEHDVSLASAAAVRAALHPRHDVVELTIGRDGRWRDAHGATIPLARVIDTLELCDVVFPAVHGPRGEDGTLAALLDLVGVPYVGSGLRAGAVGMDKTLTKLVAGVVGVGSARGALAGTAPVTYPAVVKPVSAGSSFGVARVVDADELAQAVRAASELDARVLVEEFVHGREIDIAVLTRSDGTLLVSAPLEILVDGDLFDSTTKYDGSAAFRVPADLTADRHRELEQHALAVHDALGCAGVARIDFFLTDDGWVLNEVNTMPGLTEQSQVPRMFEAIGMPYRDLIAELVAAAKTHR